ncbi:MAG TPA: hypothetical protein VIV54_06270 [Burkholderiales bacterium]
MDLLGLPVSEIERASREDLLHYLEEISGRAIRTRADVEQYVEQLSAAKAQDKSARRWQTAKSAVLLALVTAAALQYYLLDIMLQIASLRQLTFFVG